MALGYILTRDVILKGEPCPPELEANLTKLLLALNTFRTGWGWPLRVTSGYRTPAHNKSVQGKPHSAHLTCEAADLEDSDRKIASFCRENESLLELCGLWLEDPSFTSAPKPWVHLQTRPASHRIFIP